MIQGSILDLRTDVRIQGSIYLPYPSNAIYEDGSYGPTFGSTTDLCIANGCSDNNSSQCNFPYFYCGTRARALSGGSYNFRVNELEVYQINII